MRVVTHLLLISVLFVSACATIRDSRVNPANWFSRGEPEQVAVQEDVNPLIPNRNERRVRLFQRGGEEVYVGGPVDQVSDLIIERVPGGALIRATGVSPFQGAYDARLEPVNPDEIPVDGVLTYRLEAVQPRQATFGGPQRVRTVTVARRISDIQLAGVRTIRVEGARNAQTARR